MQSRVCGFIQVIGDDVANGCSVGACVRDVFDVYPAVFTVISSLGGGGHHVSTGCDGAVGVIDT